MPTANSFSPSLLAPAILVARKVLARLEDEEVPARLRGVAKKSGKLPSPLARSLIAELDQNHWLREKVLSDWASADTNDPNPSRAASAEFLIRGDGWEERVIELASVAAQKSEDLVRSRSTEELRQAKSRIETLRGRLEELERSHSALKGATPATSSARTVFQDEVDRVKESMAELRRELDRARRKASELQARNTELTERVEDLLRRRPQRAEPRAPAPSGLRREAIELARDLDARLRALTVPPKATAPTAKHVEKKAAKPFSLPPGTRPDSAAAVEWLLAWADHLTIAVDGWNLAFSFQNPPGKKERHRVEAAVGQLAVKSVGERRLLVFFDSRLEIGQATVGTHPEVEVQFPLSADEALIEMAAAIRPLVVISSDRRVREDSDRAGAISLWGEALVDWLNRDRP